MIENHQKISDYRKANPNTQFTEALILDILNLETLVGADLVGVQLSNADLRGVDLSNAKVALQT